MKYNNIWCVLKQTKHESDNNNNKWNVTEYSLLWTSIDKQRDRTVNYLHTCKVNLDKINCPVHHTDMTVKWSSQ